MTRRYKIYLAGPITGCNPDQAKAWRRRVRRRWGGEHDFIDPTDPLRTPDDGFSVHDIVSADEKAITDADAVLASMWKESIGTSIGVVLARRSGKPVVVIDRNYLHSSILGYWSDGSDPTEDGAMEKLLDLLEAQRKLEFVVKRDEVLEEFRRDKLARSIRRACADAKNKNDILVAADIMPRLVRNLCQSEEVRDGKVPASTIKKQIVSTLQQLELIRPEKFEGVREAWERYGAEIEASKEQLDKLNTQIVSLNKEMEEYNDDAMNAERSLKEETKRRVALAQQLHEKEELYAGLQKALDEKKRKTPRSQVGDEPNAVGALRVLFPDFDLLDAGAEQILDGKVTTFGALTDALVKIRHGNQESKRFKSTEHWLEARVNLGRGAQVGRLYYRQHPERQGNYLVLLSTDHGRQETQDRRQMQQHDQSPSY